MNLKIIMQGLKKWIRSFFLPSLTPAYALRVGIVILLAYFCFRYLCIPMYIKGESMAPTYLDGEHCYCWRMRYWLSGLKRGDIVMVRYAGTRIMLLKRIVALEGDTVAFKNGKLLVNGQKVDEPYVKFPSDWQMAERKVEPGKVYVVGDNRSMPIDNHVFGRVYKSRIVGGPLW